MAKKRKGRDEEPAIKPQKIPEKLQSPFADALRTMAAEKAAAEKRAAEAKRDGTKDVAKPGAANAGAHAKKAGTPAAPAKAPAAPPPPKSPADPLGHYAYDDRAAFHQAFAGVRTIEPARGKKGPSAPRVSVSKEEKELRDRHQKALDEAEQVARARLETLVSGGVRFGITREEDGVYGVREGTKDTILNALTAPTLRPEASLDLHGVLATDVEREVARFVRERRGKGDRNVIIVHGKGLHSEGGHGVLDAHVVRALSEGAAAASVLAFATAPIRLGGRGALVVRLLER